MSSLRDWGAGALPFYRDVFPDGKRLLEGASVLTLVERMTFERPIEKQVRRQHLLDAGRPELLIEVHPFQNRAHFLQIGSADLANIQLILL